LRAKFLSYFSGSEAKGTELYQPESDLITYFPKEILYIFQQDNLWGIIHR